MNDKANMEFARFLRDISDVIERNTSLNPAMLAEFADSIATLLDTAPPEVTKYFLRFFAGGVRALLKFTGKV